MTYSDLARLTRCATLATFVLLVLIISANRWLSPVGDWQINSKIWLMQCVPLLIFLPGLWRGALRSYAWLCFVILFYFAAAVTRLFLPHAQAIDTINLILTVALFVFALLFIRWRARANRASANL